jgi:hypothetical protein
MKRLLILPLIVLLLGADDPSEKVLDTYRLGLQVKTVSYDVTIFKSAEYSAGRYLIRCQITATHKLRSGERGSSGMAVAEAMIDKQIEKATKKSYERAIRALLIQYFDEDGNLR